MTECNNRYSGFITPIALLCFVASLQILGEFNILPSPAELTERLQELFNRFGLLALALCSFLENIVGLNIYLPGSIVVVTAMGLTAGDLPRAVPTFLTILLSGVIAHLLNYTVGRLAGSRGVEFKINGTKALSKQNRSSILLLFFTTLWHPHLASLTCFASGVARIPTKRFLAYFVPIGLVWNFAWGGFLYLAGDTFNTAVNLWSLFYIYIAIWLFREVRRSRRDTGGNGQS